MSECAFCDNLSDYVLTVTDPAPEHESVLSGEAAVPICREHLDDLKEANLQ